MTADRPTCRGSRRAASICLAVLIGAVALVFFAGDSARAVTANKPSLLQDLPQAATRFIVQRYAFEITVKAHAAEFDLRLRDAAKPPEASEALIPAARVVEKLLALDLSPQSILQAAADHDSVRYDLTLEGLRLRDPGPTLTRLAVAYREVEARECEAMRLVRTATPTVREERHNFIVHYARSVQKLCGNAVEWAPTGIDTRHDSLFRILKNPQENRSKIFWDLHNYLENPNNNPFLYKINVFLCIYTQYLALAYDARFVSLAVNEFLTRHDDQFASHQDLGALRPLLAVQLMRGTLQ